MNIPTVGDWVDHPKHGRCRVTFVGESHIGVRFPEGGDALLRLDELLGHSTGEPEKQEPAASLAKADTSAWPDSTYVFETDSSHHFMGSHWQAFFDTPDTILSRLPLIYPESTEVTGYGSFYPAPHAIPSDWAEGKLRFWPLPRKAVVLGLREQDGATHLLSVFPKYGDGVQVTLVLDEVRVWDSQVTAQIVATWGGAEIAFFDTAFLANRGWYEAGREYDFILSGIAYEAGYAVEMAIPYNPHPDEIAWERKLAEERGDPMPEVPREIRLEGMAMFLSVAGWDIDDYRFRGPVQSVKPVDDMLGQKGWRVRLTVMRFDDEVAADLDVLITEKAWGEESPPEPGQDIEGSLWLQGHLWSPGDWARPGGE